MKKYQMDGYVIDAEAEFEQSGRAAVATTFMTALRAGLPNTTVAICSFRWPTYHPTFPWTAFLNKCDLNMPQVYWMSQHNPAVQLDRTLTEFKAITPDEKAFLDEAKKLGMTAANFFSWDDSRKNLPDVWTTISNYSWSYNPPTVKDITQQFIDALNTKNLDTIMTLFTTQCVHIDAKATIQGTTAIRAYFSNLINNILPGATFQLGTTSGTGSTRSFAWTATSTAANVIDGSDTFGLIYNQIAYHYTFYHVTTA
jgi:ketosteroid isomerase-like protein